MDLDRWKKTPNQIQRILGENQNWGKLARKIASYVLIILLVTSVGVVGIGAGLVSALVKDEKLRTKEDYDKELSGWSQTSYAYFRSTNGNPKLIGQLTTPEDRKLVKNLDEVSPYLINAFLSTEIGRAHV